MESDKEKWHEITEEQYNYIIEEYQLEGFKPNYTSIEDMFGETNYFFIGTDWEFKNFLKECKVVEY